MHARVGYVPLVAALILFLAGTATQAEDASETLSAATSAVVHGDGSWMEAGRSASSQAWNLDALHFADGQMSGRINVSGSPIIESANVEGRFSGRGLSGTVLDDDGKELARFEGSVTRTGAVGTYRDYKGGVGQWHWDGLVKP